MTTAAVEYILRDLIPPFEHVTGHKVAMTVLGTGPAVAKIKEGTFADMILLGPPALNELAAAGKVDASTIAPAFHSRIGLAVRAGAKKPDIGTPEALKHALLDAKSIGYSISRRSSSPSSASPISSSPRCPTCPAGRSAPAWQKATSRSAFISPPS
jgi:molybdate transport system substrate-binding protein